MGPPNPLHAILVEYHIQRDGQPVLHQALGDQHQVEGIAMVQRQIRGVQSVFNVNISAPGVTPNIGHSRAGCVGYIRA
jgi:hypothetical protein